MFKKLTSIFFTLLFIGVISAPTILSAIDNSIDITILFSISEEEEELKNFKVINSNNYCENQIGNFSTLKLGVNYTLTNYPRPPINLIYPPPELGHIL